MNAKRTLFHDTRGAAAIEFAVVAPVFLLLMIGILQFGLAFYANAGLRHGVEAAARYAQVYPRPSDSEISSKFTSSTFGVNTALLGAPSLTHGTANGVDYVEVSASYNYPLEMGFMPMGSVNLTSSRRAYLY
jgi:Flp pilus assembly protein TadG